LNFWDKEKREEVKTDFEEKFSWMDEDAVLEEIRPKIFEVILSILDRSIKRFDESGSETRFLGHDLFSVFVNLEYKKLFYSIKREHRVLKSINKMLEKNKKCYLNELRDYGNERVKSLQIFFQSLNKELQKFSKEKRGFLSIYACGKELEQLISEGTVRLHKEKIGETGVQAYFCELVGTKDPVHISSQLIKLLRLVDGFTFEDGILVNFTDEWRKSKKRACIMLTNKLCQLDEFKNAGRTLYKQLNYILPRILPDEPDFQTVKSALSLMLCERGILELEVFREMVNSGIPSIPKLEVTDEGKKVGECDVFAMIEENRFIGLEVTLRRELEDKRSKLRALARVDFEGFEFRLSHTCRRAGWEPRR